MTTVFEGTLFADYHQFYLTDTGGGTDYSPEVTDEGIARRIVCLDGVLVIFTERNMDVPVRVELYETEPALEFGDTDHVVEGGFRSAGTVAIAGCTDYLPDAARFPAPPGDLKAVVVFAGLDTLSEDGLEGEDRYTVHLWPGKAEGICVLKQWKSG